MSPFRCLLGVLFLVACNPPPVAAGASTHQLGSQTYGLGYTYLPENHTSSSLLGTDDAGVAQSAGATDGGVAGAPASVDNSSFNPPVGNQGQIGSCVAWAVGYGLGGYLANKQGLGALAFSPMDIYTQVAPNCPDCGMEISQAFGFMVSGIDLAMSFDSSLSGTSFTDYGASVPGLGDDASANDLAAPSATILLSGEADKLVASQNIFDAPPSDTPCSGSVGATAAIQVAMSQGYGVVVALPIFPEFDDYDGVHPVQPPTATEVSRGGHAIFCSKYDPNGLWCQNQWGASWGNAGWVQLAWPFVEQCLYEADTGSQLATGSPPIEPQVLSPASGAVSVGALTVSVGALVPSGKTLQSLSVQVGSTTLPAVDAGALFVAQFTAAEVGTPNAYAQVVPIAQDTQGNTYQGSAIEVFEAQPALRITEPLNGTTVETSSVMVAGAPWVPNIAAGAYPGPWDCQSPSLTLVGTSQPAVTVQLTGAASGATQSFPFQYLFASLANDTYTVTASCNDPGSPWASSSVSFTVNAAPPPPSAAITWVTPALNENTSTLIPLQGVAALSVSISSLVSVTMDQITVQLIAQPLTTTGTLIASSLPAAATVSTQWDTTQQEPQGELKLVALVMLNGAQIAESDTWVSVDNPAPPPIFMSSPTSGQAVAGTITLNVGVNVSCQYNAGLVQYTFSNGTSVVSPLGETAEPFDTTTLPNGSYTVTPFVTICSQSYTGAPVSFTVNNACGGYGASCTFNAGCCNGLSCDTDFDQCWIAPGGSCGAGHNCANPESCDADSGMCDLPCTAYNEGSSGNCCDGLAYEPEVAACEMSTVCTGEHNLCVGDFSCAVVDGGDYCVFNGP